MLMALFFAVAVADAATLQPAQGAALPALLQEVEAKYSAAGTLIADFTQVNESAAMHTKKTSSGQILVKRPDKVRWETLKPDTNLMVSDGHKFWFYTPPFDPTDKTERGQVIERPAAQAQSRLAQALLSGRFSAEHEMKIRVESPSRFVLTPRKGSAGSVVHAVIDVDPKEKLIEKVVLEHSDGNRSEITLSHIRLGEAIRDPLFVFIAPPGTDKE